MSNHAAKKLTAEDFALLDANRKNAMATRKLTIADEYFRAGYSGA